MQWLQIVGVGLEGVGVLVALIGLRGRFKKFAPPGRREFDPAVEAARRSASRFAAWSRFQLRRILRRRPKRERHEGSAQATLTFSTTARGRVGYGALPEGRSNKPAMAELDRRTRDLLERVSNVADDLQDGAARLDRDINAARDESRVDNNRLDEQMLELATGDVPLQYLGLGMIAVGLIAQAVGAFLSL